MVYNVIGKGLVGATVSVCTNYKTCYTFAKIEKVNANECTVVKGIPREGKMIRITRPVSLAICEMKIFGTVAFF